MLKAGKLVLPVIAVFLVFLSSCSQNKPPNTFNPTDLNGKTAAFVPGTVSEDVASSLESLGATATGFSSVEDCIYALDVKKADYVVLDEISAGQYCCANKELAVFDGDYGKIDFCAVFQKGDSFCRSFNEAVSCLTENGTVKNIVNSYVNNGEYHSSYNGNHKETVILAVDELCNNVFVHKENGEYVGIDVDIAKEVCEYSGYNLQISAMEFDEAFSAVKDGSVRFFMSEVTPNAERLKEFELSDTYFSLNFVLVGKKD